MNRQQKIAWFLVVVISVAVITSVCAFTLLYMRFGMPKASAGFSFLAIAALGAFSPFGKDKSKVTCDERDKSINRYAALAGFGAAYLFVGLACMIPFSALGPTATISVTWLPMIFCGTFLSSVFVRSLAILIQYGREPKGEQL